MSWTTITIADLEDRKVADLVKALREEALGTSQTDPVPNIIADATLFVRTAVKSCSANTLDADTTKIPATLKGLACRMILREAQSRLRIQLKDDERAERDADEALLREVASCKRSVDAPDTPETTPSVQTTGGSPVVSTPDRFFSRDQQDGM